MALSASNMQGGAMWIILVSKSIFQQILNNNIFNITICSVSSILVGHQQNVSNNLALIQYFFSSILFYCPQKYFQTNHLALEFMQSVK